MQLNGSNGLILFYSFTLHPLCVCQAAEVFVKGSGEDRCWRSVWSHWQQQLHSSCEFISYLI